MSLSIIVAVAANGVIGKDNQLIWHLSDDLKWFKKCTMGKPIIMGRKTFESLPRLLPGRTHFVLSTRKDYQVPEGVRLFHDVETLMENLPEGENFVIGGEHIYSLLLPKADKVYMTKVEKHMTETLFSLHLMKRNGLKRQEFPGEGDIPHTFVIYRRK